MRPTELTPQRVSHRVRGQATLVRTESTGRDRGRAPIVRFDTPSGDATGFATKVAWSDLTSLTPELEEPSSMRVDGDTAVLTEPVTRRPRLGDVGQLIRERGLDPEEWVVVSTTLNEWDSMAAVRRGAEPRTVRLKQWKVTLRRAPHLILAAPAAHVPPVKRVPGPPSSERPDVIVVEGDHHAPYQDQRLHEASVDMLAHLAKHRRLSEHVFLGDTGDYPTISRHADHPSAMASVNDVTQGTYDLLREKVLATPGARHYKLKGNHDWRLESELLARAERLYGIKPADTGDGKELPALSLRRLLHLDALGVELVESPLGWEHAEIELVPGPTGLVVRHGWLVGKNTAARSLDKRGRSIIVGHKHTREHVFKWDPSVGAERQAVVIGVMCQRDKRFGHYAPLNDWAQGLGVVTRWPDGAFEIEHARWDGERLSWRDYRWSA